MSGKRDIKVPHTNYVVPKGWFVCYGKRYTYSREHKYFKDPELFLPERYIPGGPNEIEKQFHNVLIPFGKGLHQCPGKQVALMELKVLLIILCLRAGPDGKRWPKLSGNLHMFIETPFIQFPKLEAHIY